MLIARALVKKFKLELSGVTQADMDKKLEVRLDKKTLFLKDFKLGFIL